MKAVSLTKEIASTTYPGRGIVLGRTADGTKAVIAYFIADYLRARPRARQQNHRHQRRPNRHRL